MHFCLYLCIPVSDAKTSLQARRKAAKYLEREGFASEKRFAGVCDYYCIGGRWSGRLELLRLRSQDVRKFNRLWKQLDAADDEKRARKLFKQFYPDYRGNCPVCRNDNDFFGAADDAQIIDETLLSQLEKGFGEEVRYTWEPHRPNVLFTDLGEGEWDDIDILGKYWVVVVDYHD